MVSPATTTSYIFTAIGAGGSVEARVTLTVVDKGKMEIKMRIGIKTIYVNNRPQEIDVPPMIVEGRTLLPIRWVVEPLGATVSWDETEKKVTIVLKTTVIELWIGNNTGKVNRIEKFIDPANPKVVPILTQGRTMLPVRFVAENLGCKVEWESTTKTVTIIYPAS